MLFVILIFSLFVQAEEIPSSFDISQGHHGQEIQSCVENVMNVQLSKSPFFLQAQVLVGETAGWVIPTAVEVQWRESLAHFDEVAGRLFIETLACVEKYYPKKDLATLMAMENSAEKRESLLYFYSYLVEVDVKGAAAGEESVNFARTLAKSGHYQTVNDSSLQPHLETLTAHLQKFMVFTYIQRALDADAAYQAAIEWMKAAVDEAATEEQAQTP